MATKELIPNFPAVQAIPHLEGICREALKIESRSSFPSENDIAIELLSNPDALQAIQRRLTAFGALTSNEKDFLEIEIGNLIASFLIASQNGDISTPHQLQ